MFTLVIGGAASGKSEYAEAHVETLPGRRLYIATMEPWDEECRARIARHQAARAHKRFTTVECYRNLSQLTVPPDSNVLLECLGNLVANERYGRQGGGVVPVDPVQRQNREAAGRLACLLAQRADRVIRVFCGLPQALKGELP